MNVDIHHQDHILDGQISGVTLLTPISFEDLELTNPTVGKYNARYKDKSFTLTRTPFLIVRDLIVHAGITRNWQELFEAYRKIGSTYKKNTLRANVRGNIKRIRIEFRGIDSDFKEIVQVTSIGYRWGKPSKPPIDSPFAIDMVSVGNLELFPRIRHVYWKEQFVDLTCAEVTIIQHLASDPMEVCSYRKLYDAMRGVGFIAGRDGLGHMTNVRTAVKKLRQEFKKIDPLFNAIICKEGEGYLCAI